MTIIELKDQIIKNQLSSFYIFVGEEIGIINIYIEQMSNKVGLPVIRADSVLSVYSKCTTRSIFGNSDSIYVIRGDKDFMKEEKVHLTIEQDVGKNIIILLYDKLDSRLKFGKFFKDQTITFEKLAPNVLKSYVKKACPGLSDKNCEHLIELCNGSYDLCMLEIDKILHYQETTYDRDDYKDSVNHCFDMLLKSGVIYQPELSDVFKLAEAVCLKRKQEAIKLANTLQFGGIQSVNILGTLYNSLKSVLLIQCCEGGSVCEVTGLSSQLVYFNKRYVGKYPAQHLIEAIKLIANVISGIKTGWIDDSYATIYVLVNIL